MPKKGGFPAAEVQEIVQQALAKALGDSNMADRALGFGRPVNGRLVGKQRAVWAQVRLTATTDLSNVEVPHALGMVPVLCRYHHSENTLTPDIALAAEPVHVDKWTKTTCRMRVYKIAGTGSIDGTLATFMVGGE